MLQVNEFETIINRRRSNRRFDDAIAVPDAVIEKAIEHAILAPNSSNMQLWEFHWIHDKKLIQEFVPLCLGQNAASSAKELVVFVTRRDLYKRRARWNKDQILKHLGDREPNKIEKNGVKIIYRNKCYQI